MQTYPYEFLSAACANRLAFERAELPMHSAVLQIFEAGSLRGVDGGVDIDSIRSHVRASLHHVPAYRKKVARLSNGDALWVDDAHFDLFYHVRHTALPRPGTQSQLERLCARLAEQRLDPERPLWEIWVVEGLEGDRFALVTKIHSCLLELGKESGLATFLLSPSPIPEPDPPPREVPSRPLSASALQALGWRRRLSAPFRIGGEAARRLLEVEEPATELAGRIRSLKALALQRLPESVVNGPVGPHRSFETCSQPLERLHALREKLQISLDVLVLAILSGALRFYMEGRQVLVGRLDFRVSAPARVRGGAEALRRHAQIRLPIDEENPRKVVSRLQEEMTDSGHVDEAGAEEVLDELTSWIHFDVEKAIARSSHCVVSSVRGPSFPLFLLGARQLAAYPQPALAENHGLAVGLISCDGKLYWGLSGDRERIPDLRVLGEGLERSLVRLEADVGIAARPQDVVPPLALEWDESRSAGAWPTAVSAPSCPSEIRDQVFAQHRALTHLLDGVEVALKSARHEGGEGVAILRERGRRLHDRLVEHLAFEDRFLVPTVRDVDSWGEERALAIERDHQDQREVLEFVLGQLEERSTPAPVLAEQLLGLVTSVREDMELEEQGVLSADLLRDDVVVIGAEAG